MRPQQQNRRMRGRNGGGGNNNNNNRKGPNPLNRNYESNGPDVKIRGSAQQIAEKYTTLARDAMSSGDRVMAENYLQHAEHYNRIIAAAQAQMPIQHVQQRNDDFDDEIEEEFENGAAVGEVQVPVVNHGAGPQPVIEGVPAEVALNSEGNREANGSRENNGAREGGGRHRDRRHQNGRRNDYGQGGQRDEQQARRDHSEPAPETGQTEAGQTGTGQTETGQGQGEQATEVTPAAAQVEQASAPTETATAAEQNEKPAEEAPRRARRPRRPRVSADAEAGAPAEAGSEETTSADS
ncbi:DUF4167 domain-containing protein [Mesorhizobium sp. SP-1A]|uniref:DUF4167 domain-containing protein n=1 Tax=Mesorhizobium sp. SP-1A TaxID=3077840 RepID=UPI0028F6E849|nr:DUF4167 domain-containing protein [Mesorhizobium sp. SP-1A]